MKISQVVLSTGRSSFVHRDAAAIYGGKLIRNGFLFDGETITPGFRKPVQAAYTVSIMLVLEDGSVGFGDCADVIAAGYSGRDRPFNPEEHMNEIEHYVAGPLTGRELTDFRSQAAEFDGIQSDGKRLHTAVRYGVTQALLHAVALSRRETMAEVIAREYAAEGAELSTVSPKILASCMRDNYSLHDRMIVKRVDIFPHANFGELDIHVGHEGELFLDYVTKFAHRVRTVGDTDYRPTLHFDVYGTFGKFTRYDLERLAEYLRTVKDAVQPYDLMIEAPIVADSRDEQIRLYKGLREIMKRRGIDVAVIVDEWCNTLEDVMAFSDEQAVDICQVKTPDLGGINNTIEAALYCKRNGTGYYLGGTANETDQSSRVTTHIGLCCAPNFLLSKPGMGADEALALQTNEINRTLALLAAKKAA